MRFPRRLRRLHRRPGVSLRSVVASRSMVREYTTLMAEVLIRHAPHDPRSTPCRAWIVLDGVCYACTRALHIGIHDAGAKHTDGGLVRW